MITWRRLHQQQSERQEGSPEADPATVQPVASLIETGDFRIDTEGRTATLRGQLLPLTFQEFDVLVFLVRHPQQVVTRQTVLATHRRRGGVYQTEFLKSLYSLREKLEAAAAGKQYLRTEPWVVYRFDPNSSVAA